MTGVTVGRDKNSEKYAVYATFEPGNRFYTPELPLNPPLGRAAGATKFY